MNIAFIAEILIVLAVVLFNIREKFDVIALRVALTGACLLLMNVLWMLSQLPICRG